MRVLWHADAGSHTGFARVTHAFGDRLVERGHDIQALAVNWRGDPEIPTKMTLWMANYFDRDDVYGARRVGNLCERLNPEVYVLYNDLPVASQLLPLIPRQIPVLLYFPIDCTNLPQWWLSPIRQVAKPVTFSRFALNEIAKVDDRLAEEVELIYHPIDASIFHPITAKTPTTITIQTGDQFDVQTREEARALAGVADRFNVLWADRNSVRKNAASFFKAMAPLCQEHPDILLWLHCKQVDEGGDIAYWIERYGLSRNVHFTPGLDTWVGVPDEQLNIIYNIADVRVSTSLGEGFGLHTGEAAAAGLPQVLPTFSCFTEVAGPGALFVSAEYPYTTARGVDLMYPAVGEITDAVRRLYNEDALRRRLGVAGRQHVRDTFDPETLATQFDAAIRATVTQERRLVLAA